MQGKGEVGLRVSELVGLNCGDVIPQGNGGVQLHIFGKGGKEREVLLPTDLGPQVLAFSMGRGPEAPLFTSHRAKRRLDRQAVNH